MIFDDVKFYKKTVTDAVRLVGEIDDAVRAGDVPSAEKGLSMLRRWILYNKDVVDVFKENLSEQGRKDYESLLGHYANHGDVGAIGGGLAYEIVPTSIGVIYTVRCFCGKEIKDDSDLG